MSLLPTQISPPKPLGMRINSLLVAPPPLLLSSEELDPCCGAANSYTEYDASASCLDSGISGGSEVLVPHSPYDIDSLVSSAPQSANSCMEEESIDFALEDIMCSLLPPAALGAQATCVEEDAKPIEIPPHFLNDTEDGSPTFSPTSASSVPHSANGKPYHRKEPSRAEFDSEEAYLAAWEKWRRSRNSNNKSVRRCRENMRHRKRDHALLCQKLEQEQVTLHNQLLDLIKEMAFFNRALSDPETLTTQDKQYLRQVIKQELVKAEKQDS